MIVWIPALYFGNLKRIMETSVPVQTSEITEVE
jgi:hypothetical protein